jgi:hypothetical protein
VKKIRTIQNYIEIIMTIASKLGAFQMSKIRFTKYLKDQDITIASGAGNKRIVMRHSLRGGGFVDKAPF